MSSGLQDGTIFAGRYRVLRRIAQGGMGAVFEVMHVETDRRRALKVMHPHILGSDEMRERFKLEAKIAANIESDFIVDVFDAGVDQETQMPFLVMELLRGEELSKRVKRLGRLPPEEVVSHLHQAALALDKTHRASIVHRDLKPENLFLAEREDSPPRIKILDFGIAKIVAESATSGGTTQSIGTPLYMSPEQFNPSAKLSGASDIYALGMIAYTLLVGAPYWSQEARGGNIFAMAAVAIHGPPQPASVRAAARSVALPPAFDAWFAKMTAVNPGARYPTATQAARALAEVFGVVLPAPGGTAMQSVIAPAPASGPVDAGQRSIGASAPRLAADAASDSAPYLTIGTNAVTSVVNASAPPSRPVAGPSAAWPLTPATPLGAAQTPASLLQPAPPSAPSPMARTAPSDPQAIAAQGADAASTSGMTALGASITRPLPQAKGKGGLVGGVLALGVIALGGAAFLAVRSARSPASSSSTAEAQTSPPTASVAAAAPPAQTPPTASVAAAAPPAQTPPPATSAALPPASVAPRPPDPATSPSATAAPAPTSVAAVKPAPSVKPAPGPASTPTATARAPKKYTPD